MSDDEQAADYNSEDGVYEEEGEYEEEGQDYEGEEGEYSDDGQAGEDYDDGYADDRQEGEYYEEGEENYEQDGEYLSEGEDIPLDNLPPLEDVKVALKPRCNLLASVKEFRTNDNVGSVELDVWKNFLRDADEEHVWALFDSLGQSPRLLKFTIVSKGSVNQSLPVSYLCHLIGEAIDLEEFRNLYINWTGGLDEFDVLAHNMAAHTRMRLIQLHVESVDILASTIQAAGKIQTLEEVEIQTTQPASDKAWLATALHALCTSRSLRVLKLVHLETKIEVIADMAKFLATNEVLEELFIQATEMDATAGFALAEMVATNQGLRSLIIQVDQLHHGPKVGDAFIQALERNSTIKHFQIILDGRMSDMKVVRAVQMQFRDCLRPTYNVSSQVGLSMGVTAERPED